MILVPLDGTWSLAPSDDSLPAIPAPVPGSVHDALLGAAKLPDAHLGYNERDQLWVGAKDWIYRRSLEVAGELLAQEHVELVCEGLDTVCRIVINGEVAGQADNMFRVWRFDLRRLLRPGRNEISLHFSSVQQLMSQRTAERHLPAWNESEPGGKWGPVGRGYVRKQACQFGWDWGPQCPSAGPWRPLRIEAWSTARLGDWRLAQQHRDDGRVMLSLFVQPDSPADLVAEASLRLGDQRVASIMEPFWGGWEWVFPIEDPALWWPNGMGRQPLYSLEVILRAPDGRELDRVEKRIGLRRIELVREPDAQGRSFYFKVNGRPFFAKGSNWIPPDAHPSAANLESRYRRDLQSACEARMNMLRVWGGGYFAHDAFYDLCDELGLLVWQDLMFGCGTYPVWDAAFRESVWHETVDAARRLRHHACLACWCGNNELEQGFTAPAWVSNGTGAQAIGKMAWASYLELFERVLPSALALADPDTPYFRGSPHCAAEDGRDSSTDRSGDIHLWDVWFSPVAFEQYRSHHHRFSSEFGFQSLPSADTLRRFAPPGEIMAADSPWLAYRQRSQPGNARVIEKTVEFFGADSTHDFDRFCLLTQIVQGLALKTGIEHWRRNFPRVGGATYWQLNDRWAAPTWATLEHEGRWKASHHLVRHFFAPLHVVGIEDAGKESLEVFVLNDHPQHLGGRVEVRLTTTTGRPLGGTTLHLTAAGGSQSTPAGRFDLRGLVHPQTFDPADCLVWLSFRSEDPAFPLAENLVLLERPCRMNLPEPAMEWAVAPAPDSSAFDLHVRNGAIPALWVHARHPRTHVHCPDFFCHLAPGRERTFRVEAEAPWDGAAVSVQAVHSLGVARS